MHSGSPDSSPARLVLGELADVRQRVSEMVQAYSDRVDAELAEISKLVEEKSADESKTRDMRDMLTVLHGASLKPGKGRRKDLKKVDNLLEDLKLVVENWR